MIKDKKTIADSSSRGENKPVVIGRFSQYLDEVVEGLESVERRQRSYAIKPNDWFFPSDVYPHSAKFKYRCGVLAKAGIIETDNSSGRWGKRYRVPENGR